MLTHINDNATPKKRASSGTRGRILEAMLTLVAERGYIGASTRELAKRAGVSEPTLFRLFGSKERIFEAMLHELSPLGRLRENIEEASGLQVKDALISIGVNYLEMLRERKPFIRIIVSEITTYPDQVRAAHGRMIGEIIATFGDFLKTRQQGGELRPDLNSTELAGIFLKLMLSIFITEDIIFGRTVSGDSAMRWASQCVEIFLNGTVNASKGRGNKSR